MRLGIDFRYGPQEPEWETVLHQVRDIDDALALSSLFEYRDDVLFANDISIDALVTDAMLLSERGFADLLASHLHTLDGESWSYVDLYRPTRGRDAEQDRVADLIARCRAAGIELTHRSQPPTPWRVVLAQVASEPDAAALTALVADHVANNWPIDLEDDLPALPSASVVATPEQIDDFRARCRRAGVALRRL
jgi:hypothetical protein